MKEWLKRKINDIIYKVVFDNDKSINQKVWELSEYFNRYDNKEIRPEILPFMKPEPKEIKSMIIDSYRSEPWLQINIFNKYSAWIADVLISEFTDKLI